jgi:hypothetical protein
VDGLGSCGDGLLEGFSANAEAGAAGCDCDVCFRGPLHQADAMAAGLMKSLRSFI